MAISSNYQQPVLVNGYVCWNCHQVSEAQKDINPQSPAASPNGAPASTTAAASSPSVVFGGRLAGQSASPSPPAAPALLNVTA